MVRSSTPVPVVVGACAYGLSLAAHLRASSEECRILHFIGHAASNGVGPACRFVDGIYGPARHLAQHPPAVPARLEPAPPRIRSLGCEVLP
jgi:hypothetical protein